MFSKFDMNYKNNLFEELSKSTKFEKLGKGRYGAVLADIHKNVVPIVRTTTKYNNPIQKFSQIHYDIMKNIKDINFNNALIEIYDKVYTKMGEHSDQALDLDINSYICLFSCYNNPDTKEKQYYRYLYESYYCGTEKVVPYFWMPKWVNATDASARTLDIYED
jgi:hypothetical protein